MPESRRGLRAAIVILRIFAIAGVMFALSALGGLFSSLVRGQGKYIPPLTVYFLAGVAVATLFYFLGEAGVILLRLEAQEERLREWIEETGSGASHPPGEENE